MDGGGMMLSPGQLGAICASCFALGLILSFPVFYAIGVRSMQAQAIQRGYALHCPQTGEFAWKGECDE